MKKYLFLLLILIIPSFVILLQKGYFSMHDDLQSMRQYQQDICFADGQIPCRWVPHMGYGYGYPLFNFYPPLPYLLGQPFSWMGFQYIDTVKIVGIIGWTLSAIFMYLLGREFWEDLGGLVSALFYTYAPYHSVDFYVRGAINEFWAMVFYPAVLWATYRLIKSPSIQWLVWTSLFVTGLMLSHNPMLMIFAPVLLTWCLFWMIRFKTLRPFSHLTIAAVWAFGLAAFFTLPVVFEQKYVSVWTLTSGYFNYLAHYLDIRQIFLNINWGYGSSELGPADTMSFALGYLHWIAPLLVVILSLTKKIKSHALLIFYLLSIILFSLFMTHSKSTFLWQHIKPLEFLQFPWRFLTISVFAASLLSGAIAKIVNHKMLIACFLTLLILLNGNYFKPREWYPDMTDSLKFSGKSWQLLVTSGIFDYLPIWAPFPPADPAGADVNVTHGVAQIIASHKQSNVQKYAVEVGSSQATLELQTYYFPGWRIFLDGHEVALDPLRDPLLGRMQVDVPEGTHDIVARFTNTSVRTLGNTISLISWVTLGILLLTYSNKFVRMNHGLRRT